MKKMFLNAIMAFFILTFNYSAADDCPDSMQLHDYFTKLQNFNANLIYSEQQVNMAKSYEKIAGRILNPELEFFTARGRDYSVTNLVLSETRLWFQLQLGDKIKKRKDLALVENHQRSTRHEIEKLLILKEAALIWMRQNQVNDELEYRQKALKEIIKVEIYYSSKPHLSPDHEIEAGIIQLIRDEFQITIAHLLEESSLNMQLMRALIGNSCDFRDVAKLRFPIPNPEKLKASSQKDGAQSSLSLKLTHLQTEWSEKLSQLENSKAIPDLKVGPLLQTYSAQNGPHFTTAGFMFVLPLPILDRNVGNREIAIKETELKKRLYLQEVKAKEDLLQTRLEQYERQIEVLKKSQSVQVLRNKLTEIGKRFDKGRLSLSLIAEFQRQLNEMTAILHKQEIKIVNELFEIWELSGRNSSDVIQLIEKENL